MSSVKILYIGNQLASSGRTATTIDTLAPLLREQGYPVKTASDQPHKTFRLLHMLWMTFKLRNWAHLVLIDTYSTTNFWYAILSARLCEIFNLRYVPILHGGNLPDRLKSNPQTTHRFFSNAYKVVCPSAYLNSAFAKANYSNFHIIPNSIELANYSFKKRSVIQPKLLWVRAFSTLYNPMMALQVLEEIQKYFPNAMLTMVGPEKDGSLDNCKKYVAKHNLPVQFTGILTKSEWLQESKSHDVFINTSQADNLPVSLIEAMALGLPVVSTNVGGIPVLIDDQNNGILVGKEQVLQMSQAIFDLLNNPSKTEQISINARSTAERYDWNHIKTLWDKVLVG